MRRLFLVFVPLVISACAAPTASPVPTPNIAATVQAQVRATLTAVPTRSPTATPIPSGPTIGQTVWLYAVKADGSAAERIELVREPSDFIDYAKVAKANDIVGLVELEAANRMFGVESGRKALVIDTKNDVGVSKVRVLEGPKAPLAGWTDNSWLRFSPP